MSDIQRWEPIIDNYELDDGCMVPFPDMEDVIDGNYVLYSDHLETVKKALEPKVCRWTRHSHVSFATGCGSWWTVDEVDAEQPPYKAGINCCPVCGGKIEVV